MIKPEGDPLPAVASVTSNQQNRNAASNRAGGCPPEQVQGAPPPHRRPPPPTTEAQLRWAQFHQKRRAAALQESLARLYHTPDSPSEVPGATSDDGNSSTTSSSSGGSDRDVRTERSESKHKEDLSPGESQRLLSVRKKKNRPGVSRGRRALLRVSRRCYEQRRALIAQHGYRRRVDLDADRSDDDSPEGEECDDREDDALAAIFAEESWLRKRRATRRRKNRTRRLGRGARAGAGGDDDEDLDRIRRFEEAFHSLMMTLSAQQHRQRHEIVTATKIWKRSTEPADLDFTQWRLPTGRKAPLNQTHRDGAEPGLVPDDGEVYADSPSDVAAQDPKRTAYQLSVPEPFAFPSGALRTPPTFVKQGGEGKVPMFVSPCRLSFRELVDLLQQQLGDESPGDNKNPSTPPRMRLNKFFTATVFEEKKDDGEYSSAPFEDADGTGVDDNEEMSIESLYLDEMRNSSALLEELEQAQPGISRQLFQLYLQDKAATPFTARRQLLSAAKRHMELYAIEYLSQSQNVRETEDQYRDSFGLSPTSAGVVQELVSKLEKSIRQDPSIWHDGKLHKPAFASLVRKYLAHARRQKKWMKSSPGQRRAFDVSRGLGPRRLLESFPGDDGLADESEEEDNDDPFAQVLQQERDEARHSDPEASHASSQFVESLVNQLPDEELLDSKGRVTHLFKGMVARYLEQAAADFEPARSPLLGVLQEDVVEANEGSGCPKNELDEAQATQTREFVHEFVCHLQKAHVVDPIFTPEGKLVSDATLEKFVSRFINQSAETPTMGKSLTSSDHFLSIKSPELLARARQQSARKPQNRPCTGRPHALRSPESTRRFVQLLHKKLEQRAMEMDPLSASTIEGMVEDALREVCEVKSASLPPPSFEEVSLATGDRQMSLFDDFALAFASSLGLHLRNRPPGSLQGNPANLDKDELRQIARSCLSTLTSPPGEVFVDGFIEELMERFHESFDEKLDNSELENVVRGCVDHAMTRATRSIDTKFGFRGVKKENTSTGDDEARVTSAPAHTVSRKLDGLLKWYNRNEGSVESEDELRAVAAFRNSRQRPGDDDASSISSFRVPDGFKKVVENFRRINYFGASAHPQRNASESHVESVDEEPHCQSRESPELSQERNRRFHRKVKEKSAFFSDGDSIRSIIDTDGSEASFAELDPAAVSNLLLSPTILTKRLQQAIRAVEARSWDQVSYLLSANPWLAEMMDLKTNQYLVHKVALYGSSSQEGSPAAPASLNTDLVRLFPSAVHKFDNDGNLPLHMAAASANLSMILLLGDRFPSGASVRNEDGMLPLHLVILALASRGNVSSEVVRSVLEYFPGAVAVADNDGNLPIHVATSALRDGAASDVVYLLLDEADRQVQAGAMFQSKVRMKNEDNASIGTATADSMADIDEERCCNLVRNDSGETPLMVAVLSRAGWKVIEALVSGSGGEDAACSVDSDLNNPLHLLVTDRWRDPKAVMSVLRVAPNATRMKNASGMIPFEIACMHRAPTEVLLAMVLVDLPFDLDDVDCNGRGTRDDCGASWVFLTCECDDAYVNVVEDVISLCSYAQSRELCFFDTGSGDSLLARATPKCRAVLQRSLRFLGRFEFVFAKSVDAPTFRLFDAIDYGTRDIPIPDGKRVILKCYVEQNLFELETRLLRTLDLDFSLLEEVSIFAVGEKGTPATTEAAAVQFCISIEEPSLSLQGVVDGMLASEDCQTDPTVRQRYAEKVFAVLRLVAKGLRHLHALALVHGSVDAMNCAKYGNRWKLRNVLGIKRIGQSVDFDVGSDGSSSSEMLPAADVWAFGKLSFEILVGEPLYSVVDRQKQLDDWDRAKQTFQEILLQVRVIPSGADLILSCLNPVPSLRPTMSDVLRNAFWKSCKREVESKSMNLLPFVD